MRVPTTLGALLLGVLLGGAPWLPTPRSRAPSPARAVASPLAPDNACRGKPAPAIGEVKAIVLERPAPDRVVLAARWRGAPGGREAHLELVLPEGAWIVRGPEAVALEVGGGVSDGVWEVGYAPGQALDVVFRLVARLGGEPCSREVAVRIAEADDV